MLNESNKFIPAISPPSSNIGVPKKIWVPAMILHFQGMWNRNIREVEEHSIAWWEKECFFYYPYLLVSAFYGMSVPNFREKYHVSDEVTLIADSGGYQIGHSVEQNRLYSESNGKIGKRTQVPEINPLKVLRWQEENADIALTLDVPSTRIKDDNAFIEFAKETKGYTKIYFDKRENYKMKIYKIIHGENDRRREIWWNELKEYEFEGYATGVKPASDPLAQAKAIMFLYNKGIKENLHILGVSG
ncbi:unnamed protein product, partial [marine sediment metagenome]